MFSIYSFIFLLLWKFFFCEVSYICFVRFIYYSNNNNNRGLSTNLIRVFMIQILDALTVLSQSNIIHCDLKPENISFFNHSFFLLFTLLIPLYDLWLFLKYYYTVWILQQSNWLILDRLVLRIKQYTLIFNQGITGVPRSLLALLTLLLLLSFFIILVFV